MRIVLINGSPKAKGSVSGNLLQDFYAELVRKSRIYLEQHKRDGAG